MSAESPFSAPLPPDGETVPLVLVIEDNADARKTTQRLLRVWGYRSEGAQDGPSGVERALALRPSIALVDVGLPGLSGHDVGKMIREALGSSVRLVALTGYGEPEDVSRAEEAGFDLHLLKPVVPERLLQVLIDLVGPGDTSKL